MRRLLANLALGCLVALPQAGCCTVWKRAVDRKPPSHGQSDGRLDWPCFALGNGALFVFGAGVLGVAGVIVDLGTEEAYVHETEKTALVPGVPTEVPEGATALTLAFADGRTVKIAGVREAGFFDRATTCAQADGDAAVAYAWSR